MFNLLGMEATLLRSSKQALRARVRAPFRARFFFDFRRRRTSEKGGILSSFFLLFIFFFLFY
uniref:Uncharacterized protein n=1 Tax=Siphoviridae sp. ctOCb13 TaxID=2825477 RepID=A0A8S5Q2A4_9CAUD|nr:MAG TPA: hypothetical protein [Siphoviridae sp. ctOCb13]